MGELYVGEGRTYTTINAAITAHIAGDVIIVHAGTYTLSAAITIKTNAVLKRYAQDIVTINLLTSGDSITLSPGVVVEEGIKVTAPVSTGAAFTVSSAGTATVNCKIENYQGRPFKISNAASIINFQGTLITTGDIDIASGTLNVKQSFLLNINAWSTSVRGIRASGGTVNILDSHAVAINGTLSAFACSAGSFTVKNSVISGPGGVAKYPASAIMTQTGGTAEVSYCTINSAYSRDIPLFSGAVTAIGNVERAFPGIVSGINRACFTFFAVDSNHISSGSLMGYANVLASKSATMSYYPDDVDHLSDAQKAILREYSSTGNELGLEGNSSSPLDYTDPITVTYSGAGTNPVLNISGNGSLLVVSTDQGTVISINTTKPMPIGTTSVAGSLVKTLDDHVDIQCVVNDHGTGDYDDAYAYCLDDGVYSLSAVPASILWNMGRYLSEEITISAQCIRDAVGLPFDLKSYFFARYRYNADAIPYLQAEGITCAVSSKGTPPRIFNTTIQPYNLNLCTHDNSTYLFGDKTELSVRKRARDWAAYALPVGLWDGWALEENGATPTNCIGWFVDELQKCGVLVAGVSEGVSYMELPASMVEKPHLQLDSPCLGAGTKIAGITTDIEGNPLIPPYNIGPYGMEAGALGVGPVANDGPPRNNITRLTGTSLTIDPAGTYILDDTNAWRVVTGWTAGTANDFFDENGEPTPFLSQQLIDAGIGPRLYCGLRGIGGYTVDQGAAANAKIIRTLKVPTYIDTLYWSDSAEMDWSESNE